MALSAVAHSPYRTRHAHSWWPKNILLIIVCIRMPNHNSSLQKNFSYFISFFIFIFLSLVAGVFCFVCFIAFCGPFSVRCWLVFFFRLCKMRENCVAYFVLIIGSRRRWPRCYRSRRSVCVCLCTISKSNYSMNIRCEQSARTACQEQNVSLLILGRVYEFRLFFFFCFTMRLDQRQRSCRLLAVVVVASYRRHSVCAYEEYP